MTNMAHAPAMSDAAHKIREGAVELKSAVVKQGSESLTQACEQTEAAIKEYPYRSVLIAFGVGALIGAVMFRK